MKTWLPGNDFDISNLSRRQAAVFEHICSRARAGIQREIDMHEHALNLPFASSNIIAEHRLRLRECRGEMDRVAALHHRLTRFRTAALSKDEIDRLAAARDAKPDLTSVEADLVIYGMLEIPPAEAERDAA